MIELKNNTLRFRFPAVHNEATAIIDFKRTLRIPDDNREYPLPPGLGRFPIKHVDDFSKNLPATWKKHGGVFFPMYDTEAMWINFSGSYPCAVKIATGKINAVTGDPWQNKLSEKPQDYLVIPDQPWLDGYNVSDDLIRQFVAMPQGEGYSAEEQITGTAEHGGLQIIVYPMKHDVYEELVAEKLRRRKEGLILEYCYMDLDLAPGGLMRQKVNADKYGINAWDQENGYRCFVHLLNSEQYESITGTKPPHSPPSAEEYTKTGSPWFNYINDSKSLPGSDKLSQLDSVAVNKMKLKKTTLADNNPVEPKNIKQIKKNASIVQDGEF